MKPEYSGEAHVARDARDGFAWLLDLVGVLAVLAVAGVVALTAPPSVSDTLRALLTLPLVLFLPGYVLLAVAFPMRGPHEGTGLGEQFPRWRAPTLRERLAISPGLSLLLAPIFAVASSWALGRLRPEIVVGLLAAFVVVCSFVAAVRRGRTPASERFVVPTKRWFNSKALDTSRPRELASTLVLVVSIVLATSMIGYAAVDLNGNASFTHMYLATETPDGEYRLANYPEQLVVGEPTTLHVGLKNNEGQTTTYSIVVLAQRVDASDPQTVVLAQQELDRASVTVASGETTHLETTVTPTRLGTEIRLTYLLYRGEAPQTPTIQNAYEHTYIWVDVVEP